MNKGIGVAFALTMCLGTTAVQTEAAADDAASSASSGNQAQPRKRRIASVKGDKKGKDGAQTASASTDDAGASGKKHKNASAGKQPGDAANNENASSETASQTAGAQQQPGQASQSQSEAAGGSSETQAPATRPWAEGVSPENQQKALKLFREGNALLKDSVFGQAAVKYREALEYWDHPAIHYNGM